MNNKIIILIGESASGKSTLEKKLHESGMFKKAVSHTTRPIRKGEVDGVDYHYISDEEFIKMLENDEFIEHTIYRDWFYGVSKEEVENSEVPIVLVANPHGFRQIQKIEGYNILSFYIKADWRVRLKRITDRGDEIVEIFRRLISDDGVFQGIAEEVDFIIENNSYGSEDMDISLVGEVIKNLPSNFL